jgi:hypothetical protein
MMRGLLAEEARRSTVPPRLDDNQTQATLTAPPHAHPPPRNTPTGQSPRPCWSPRPSSKTGLATLPLQGLAARPRTPPSIIIPLFPPPLLYCSLPCSNPRFSYGRFGQQHHEHEQQVSTLPGEDHLRTSSPSFPSCIMRSEELRLRLVLVCPTPFLPDETKEGQRGGRTCAV